jgi:hypothetical protein
MAQQAERWIASLARNDGWTYLRLLTALIARGLHLLCPPEYQQINPSLLYAAMDCFARNDVWIRSAHDERA